MKKKLLVSILFVLNNFLFSQTGPIDGQRFGNDIPIGVFAIQIGTDYSIGDISSNVEYFYNLQNTAKYGTLSNYKGCDYFQLYGESHRDSDWWIKRLQEVHAKTGSKGKLLIGSLYNMFLLKRTQVYHATDATIFEYDDEHDLVSLEKFIKEILESGYTENIAGWYICDEVWNAAKDHRADLQAYNEIYKTIKNASASVGGNDVIYASVAGCNHPRAVTGAHILRDYQDYIVWNGARFYGDTTLPNGSIKQINDFTTYRCDVLMIDAYTSDVTVWKDLLFWARNDIKMHNLNCKIHAILPAMVRNKTDGTDYRVDYPRDFPTHKQMHQQIDYLLKLGIDGIWFYATYDELPDDALLDSYRRSSMGWSTSTAEITGNWTNSRHHSDYWSYGQWAEAVANQIHEKKEILFSNSNSVFLLDWSGGYFNPKIKKLWISPTGSTISNLVTGYSTNDNHSVLNGNTFIGFNSTYGKVNVDVRDKKNSFYNGTVFANELTKVTALASGEIGKYRDGSDVNYNDVMYDGIDEVFIGCASGDVYVNHGRKYGQTKSIFEPPYVLSAMDKPNSKVTAIATGYVYGARNIYVDDDQGYTRNYDCNDEVVIGYENGSVYIYNGVNYAGYLFGRAQSVKSIAIGDIDGNIYDDIIIGYSGGFLDWNNDGKYGNTVLIKQFTENNCNINAITTAYSSTKNKKDIFVGLSNGKVYRVSKEESFTIQLINSNTGDGEVKSIAACDVDGNGYEEIIVGYNNGSIWLYSALTQTGYYIKLSAITGPIIGLSPTNYTFTRTTSDVNDIYHITFNEIASLTDLSSSYISIDKLSTENTTSIKSYHLNQNYPNPFNPTTIIKYQIPEDGFVTLKVYDILGQEISTLVNEYMTTGDYGVEFNASNLAAGIYIYQMKTNNFITAKKMIYSK